MASKNPLSAQEINSILDDAEEMYETRDDTVLDKPFEFAMAATAVDPFSGAIIRIGNVNTCLDVDDRREDLENPVPTNLPGGQQKDLIILSIGGLYESHKRDYQEAQRSRHANSPADEAPDLVPLIAEDTCPQQGPKKKCKLTRHKPRKSSLHKSTSTPKAKRRPAKEKPAPPNNDSIYQLSKQRFDVFNLSVDLINELPSGGLNSTAEKTVNQPEENNSLNEIETSNELNADITDDEEEEGRTRSLLLSGGPNCKVIPPIRSFLAEALLAEGRKLIRKMARKQKLIGKVVGKNGTPEKGPESAEGEGKKQAAKHGSQSKKERNRRDPIAAGIRNIITNLYGKKFISEHSFNGQRNRPSIGERHQSEILSITVWAEGFASKCRIPFDDLTNDGCTLFNKLGYYLRSQEPKTKPK